MPRPSRLMEVVLLINDRLLSQTVDFEAGLKFTYSAFLLDAV